MCQDGSRQLLAQHGCVLAAESVSCVAWGGGGAGRALTLLAAAGRHLFLLSLQPFLARCVRLIYPDTKKLSIGHAAR